MAHALGPFWSWQLVAAMFLNAALQCVMISAYAARLAGALSGRVGTAISFYSIFVTVGRLASMLFTPILGSLADKAGLFSVGVPLAGNAALLSSFEWQLRAIVFAGTAGVAAGAALIPTFVMIYIRGIAAFERRGSVLKAMGRLFIPSIAAQVVRAMRFAPIASIFRLSWRRLPKEVLVLNTLVTSIYAIGVISAALASLFDPHVARTALLSSGLINGAATIAYNVVVDPVSGYFADQAAKGERPVEDVRSLVGFLALTAILGFLLSQFLLVPAALTIERASQFISGGR